MVLSTTCAGMGVVKKVNPAPGQSTWDSAARLGQLSDEVTPILLFQADLDAGGGLLTISNPGRYQVLEDLAGWILINADNVSLDLNSHRVTCTGFIGDVVTIAGGTPGKMQVAVYNGYIQGLVGANGVTVDAGCSKISLHDLTIFGCTNGASLAGVNGNVVSECSLVNLNLISNVTGLLLTYADANIVRNCNVLYSTQFGIELNNSQSNCVYDCTVLKTQGTVTTAGFKSSSGDSNMFQRCVTKQTKTSSTTFGDTANGFLLTGTETKTKILDCIVNETDVISSAMAVTYGIHLEPTLNASIAQVSGSPFVSNGSHAVLDAKWSPDGRYLAVACNDRGSYTWPTHGVYTNISLYTAIDIYSWNGTSFSFVTRYSVTTPVDFGGSFSSYYMTSLAWSPDGKYIVTGLNEESFAVAGNQVRSSLVPLTFNGTTLTAGSNFPVFGYENLNASTAGQGLGINDLQFSPDGKYVSIIFWMSGLTTASNGQYVGVYGFNGTTFTSVPAAALVTATVDPSQKISWSPNRQYFVITGGNNVVVYKYYPDGTFASVATTAFASIAVVRWSPCGKYILAGGGSGVVRIYSYDGASTLTLVATAAGMPAALPLSGAWSPDGKYVSVGFLETNNSRIYTMLFNGSSLTNVTGSPITVTGASSNIYGMTWSSDGRYIAATSNVFTRIAIVSAMYGPTNCLIDNCRVADTQATNLNMGRGFVVGGPTDIVLQSIASNNGVNYSWGIPNVYDGKFEILRSVIQPYDNVSMPELL